MSDLLSQWILLRARIQSWTGNLMAEDGMRPALEGLEEVAAARGLSTDQLLLAADAAAGAPERLALIDRLLIRTTWFMREPEALTSLTQKLRAQAAATGATAVSIWSVACSTGEEPYSLAMAALEAGLQPAVLATDISASARDFAARAIYPAERLANVPLPWRSRHFEPAGGSSVRIAAATRACVRFMHYNILEVAGGIPGWGSFHAVVCRNVLIYWAPETATDVLVRLMTACRRDGFLLLGAAEQPLARTVPELLPDEDGGWLLRRVPGRVRGTTPPPVRDIEITPPPDLLPPLPVALRVPAASPAPPRRSISPARPTVSCLADGIRLLGNGDPAGASAVLQQAVQRDPTSGPLRLWFGRALKAAGRIDDAIQELRAARGLMPDSSWLAPYQLAVCLDQQHRFQEALEAYRHAISVIEQGAPSGLGVAGGDEDSLIRTVVTSCRHRVARLARLRS